MTTQTPKITDKLKSRILNEMVDIPTPLELLKKEVHKEVGYKYDTYIDFEKEFNRAYRKVIK